METAYWANDFVQKLRIRGAAGWKEGCGMDHSFTNPVFSDLVLVEHASILPLGTVVAAIAELLVLGPGADSNHVLSAASSFSWPDLRNAASLPR